MPLFRKFYRNLPVIRELVGLRNGSFQAEETRKRIEETHKKLHERFVSIESVKLELALSSHPRYGDPKRLLKHGLQCNSQNLEDGMTWEIFRRIGTTNKIFAEVGVEDGNECNTAMLLTLGWTGYWFDGASAMLETIKRRPDLSNGSIKANVAFLDRENIAKNFNEIGVPKDIDLLSVDVDQNTIYLWEGLADWRPRVVIVEYNSAIPPDLEWKVNYDPKRCWDGTQNFGASLKAFEILGRKHGYSLVGCDIVGINAFFVRDDLIDEHKFCAPFNAENHYEPPRYAFSLYRRSHRVSLLDRAL